MAPQAGTTPLRSYQQAVTDGPSVVGGKGWNLGRLARYGFLVPAGGVLTADTYRHHLAAANVTEPRAALLSVPAADADQPETVAQLDLIRTAVEGTPLPSDVVETVQAFLGHHHLTDRALAVRSSATAEDSAAASFAGIHESYLNVTGLDAVLTAIRRCFASLWTPRAFAYRRHLGLPDDDVACAVVICAMVGQPSDPGQAQRPPVAAGVAFSADPRTGRRDRVIINAAPGLGEALVGGQIDPEEIELRADFNGLSFLERRGGTAGVLSDTQALALGRMVERVHWSLGEGQEPHDLEWVFDGEQFWLVQARPITHLPRLTAEPVKHLPIIWSNGNLKDAVAGVPTALGYSMLQPVLRSILYSYLEALGRPIPEGMETIRRLDGRVYFDLTTMQWFSYDSIGIAPAELNMTLGGMQPEIPIPGDPLRGLSGQRRKLTRLHLLTVLWRSARIYAREIARVRQFVRDRSRDDLSNLSNTEIVAWRERTGDVAMSFSRLFQVNNAGSFWDRTLSELIDKVRPGAGPRITSGLLAGSNAVVTAEHGYRLVDLARLAEAEPAALAYLATLDADRESSSFDPWGWRALPATSAFRREFERFLDEFGHRGVYEVEIANPRWIEDPTYLLEQVRTFVGQPASLGGRAKAAARRQEAEAEAATLPFWLRPLVSWLAARARHAAALREAGKSALIATLMMTRMLTTEFGTRMVAAGVIARPDDIFHLTWWDIVAWAEGDWNGAGAPALVADRAAQQAAWLALEPPDVIVLDANGRPADMPTGGTTSSWQPQSAVARIRPRPLAGTLLSGAGVSSGRVRGPARVIRHPSEGARLKAGEVLVAPSTDPGWTPLFLRASAVVMEVGGYLSHGAIVAREYGLPAVVNVPGALTSIQDGQTLEVDGDLGEVIVGLGGEADARTDR